MLTGNLHLTVYCFWEVEGGGECNKVGCEQLPLTSLNAVNWTISVKPFQDRSQETHHDEDGTRF